IEPAPASCKVAVAAIPLPPATGATMHAPRRLAVLAAAVFLPCAAQVHAQAAQATDGPSAAPPAADVRLDAIARAPSPERIEADIRTLAGFGTRHTLSDTSSDTRGIGAATRWIQAESSK